MAKKIDTSTGEAPARKVYIQRVKKPAPMIVEQDDPSKNDSYLPLKKPKKAKKSKKSKAKKDVLKEPKAKKQPKAKVDHAAEVANIPNSTVTLNTNIAPSVEIATELETAFQHFNRTLFEGKLEPVVFSNCRLKKADGYFWGKQWSRRKDLKGKVHEIGLDFAKLHGQKDQWVLSVLVHEMCHELVEMIGKAPKKAYHCKYWAAAMCMVGLTPVIYDAKGQPQPDKLTGPNSSHEIVAGGKFEASCKELMASGFKLSWASEAVVVPEKKPKGKKKKAGGKFKYEATCGNAFWGKSGIRAICQCGCESEFSQLEKPDEATEGDGDEG